MARTGGSRTGFTRARVAFAPSLLLSAALAAALACNGMVFAAESDRQLAAGQIVVGLTWEPLGFYPLRALDSASYYAQTLVYEGLVKYGDDMEIVPGLAKTFAVSQDGLTYTFDLRDGVKFCDGTNLTIEDVLASINISKSDLSPFRSDYDCIETVERAQSRIILHLNRRSAPLLSRMVELRILPARLINLADHGKAELARTPIGTGPFKLVRWESSLELVFDRNDLYWGEKPQYERLVWRVVPDKTLLTMAMRHGELDVAAIDAAVWQSMGGANAARHERFTLDQFRGSRTVYLGFNLRKTPFNDLNVRRAICDSIDREALVKRLFAGMAIVPLTDVWPGSWAYNSAAQPCPYDTAQAQEELRRSGYTLSDKGWHKGNELLGFRISTVRDFQDVAQVVADDLIRMHIPCEVQVVEYSTLRSRYMQKGQFDVVVWSRSSGPDPECSLFWGTGGLMNFSAFSSPRVDELLAQGKLIHDRKERAASYKEIQGILAKELPWVFLVQPNLLIVHRDNIANTKQAHQGMTGLPWDNPLFNAARWRRINSQ